MSPKRLENTNPSRKQQNNLKQMFRQDEKLCEVQCSALARYFVLVSGNMDIIDPGEAITICMH